MTEFRSVVSRNYVSKVSILNDFKIKLNFKQIVPITESCCLPRLLSHQMESAQDVNPNPHAVRVVAKLSRLLTLFRSVIVGNILRRRDTAKD